MNYDSADLLDRLASEYVLGTLRGPARRRLERLCAANSAALAAVQRWENDLSTFDRLVDPVQPSAQVWRQIRERLFGAAERHASRAPVWRTVALAASLAAIAIVVGLLVSRQQPSLQPLAVLGPDAAHPQWQVERARELTSLTIRVVGPVTGAAGKDFELWALLPDGKPVSLGLLPRGDSVNRSLSDAQRAALRASVKLAVSIEPLGGSPTGSPTGPVVIVVPISALS